MDTLETDELILVVHGVGDPEPGETLDYFYQALAVPQRPVGGPHQVIWINENQMGDRPEKLRFSQTYAAHERTIEVDGNRALAAEVYWGDLSRVRRGLLGAIGGILRVVFGLRYVAFVAADQPGVAAMWLRRLAMHSARLIHGPVLAVNLVLGLLSLMLMVSQGVWGQSVQSPYWADSVASVLSILLVTTAVVIRTVTHNRVVERFWFWVMACGLFLGLAVLLRLLFGIGDDIHIGESHEHHSDLFCGLFWYCRLFVVLLGLQYLWVSLVLVGMVGCWVMALLHPETHRQGLHVGFLVPTLLVGFWAFVIPMVWVSAGEALKQVVEVEHVDWLFHEAVPLLGVQCLLAVFLALSMIGVLVWYGVWRARNGVENYLIGGRSPRLILNPVVQFYTGAAALIGISVSVFIHWVQFDGTTYDDYALGTFLVSANRFSMTVLIPLAGMLLLSLQYLRPALDIVLDVVNHFYLSGSQGDQWIDDDDEFELNASGGDSTHLDFSRRRVIGQRLASLLQYYGNRLKNRPRLNILSHSQGTLITAEVLNRPELDWIRDKFSEVNLVTMGSPIHHLYQYYFPHVYPPIENEKWQPLRGRIDRWVNIFRIDDFVGTEIPFGEISGWPNCPQCSNHPVESAGHLWYWTDKQVLRVLAESQISPLLTQAVAMGVAESAELEQPDRGYRPGDYWDEAA